MSINSFADSVCVSALYDACALASQPRTRRDPVTGKSNSHTNQISEGRVLLQSIVHKLHPPQQSTLQSIFEAFGLAGHSDRDIVDAWAEKFGAPPATELKDAVEAVFAELLRMVIAGEQWSIEGKKYDEIRKDHPKKIQYAIVSALNRVDTRSELLPKGWFGIIPSFVEVTQRLQARAKQLQRDAGTEADANRDNLLSAVEWHELLESIQTASVHCAQQAEGVSTPRNHQDTLTLGVIVTMYKALGQRGMNLDDLQHGYMGFERYLKQSAWRGVNVEAITAKSSGKGDKADTIKHLAEVTHHRDPMLCPIAMLGHYFCYLYLGAKGLDLPESIADWKEGMHEQPLLQLQTGGGATVAQFNRMLKQDLKLIDAEDAARYSFHNVRDQSIAEAGEDLHHNRANVQAAHGHSTGSHGTNYRARDVPHVLTSGGYTGSDPEVQAAHSKVFYREQDGLARAVVNILYRRHRPELLRLEEEAASDTTEAGRRMREWLRFVRYCVTAYVVSMCARPRDAESGFIDARMKPKRRYVHSELQTHLDCLVATDELQRLEAAVREEEDDEICMGERANWGQMQRELAEQMSTIPAETAAQTAALLQPRFDVHSIRLDDKDELEKDEEYEKNLSPERQFALRVYDGFTYTTDKKTRRKDRLDEEARRAYLLNAAANRVPADGNLLHWMQPSSSTSAAAVTAPPASTANTALALAPAAALAAPAAAVAPTAGTSTTPALAPTVAHAAPASAGLLQSSQPAPAHVPHSSTSGDAENDRLRAQLDAVGGRDWPTGVGGLSGVRAVFENHMRTVVPKETDGRGTAWRQKEVVGKKAYESLKGILRLHEPVVLAVMQLIVGEKKPWKEACEIIEAKRIAHRELIGAYNWEKFCRNDLPAAASYANRGILLDYQRSAEFRALVAPPLPDPATATSASTESSRAVTPPVPTDVEMQDAPPPSPLEEGVERFIAFDPSTSCGWAAIDVKDRTMLRLSVGIIDLSTENGDGAMLTKLRSEVLRLLDPQPISVAIETFILHHAVNTIDIKLRGAIDMAVAEKGLTDPAYVTCQTWKATISPGNGKSAKKEIFKAAIEAMVGVLFPSQSAAPQLYRSNGAFKYDASDAAGICIWAVLQKYKKAKWARSASIDAPAPLGPLPPPPAPAAAASAVAAQTAAAALQPPPAPAALIAPPSEPNLAVTLTFSECVENHAGMQMIGQKRAEGFTEATLLQIAQEHAEEPGFALRHLAHDGECASVLVIKGGVDRLLGVGGADSLLAETLAKSFDTQYLDTQYGRGVLNKHGRHNNCYADAAQTPDIASGKGTVHAFSDSPVIASLRVALPAVLGEDARDLYAETNKYYDVSKKDVGIGFHGDTERSIVIGVRLGEGSKQMPLRFQWYQNSNPVSEEVPLHLAHGDIYVMSWKATGYDWKAKPQAKPTLRHGVGLKAERRPIAAPAAARRRTPPSTAAAAAAPPAKRARGAPASSLPSFEPFGPGTSRYYPSYITPEQEQALLKWCINDVRFQIYQCISQRRIPGGEPRLKAPKAEFYIMAPDGRRPHYKWVQLNVFNHAGQEMPPILQQLCEQLNEDFGLTGDNQLNHALIICNEQSGSGPDAHCAPPHADKIQKGFFVDISLGYPREMQLINAQTNEIAASQRLASGSLAYITAEDNGRLVQGVKRAADQPKVQGTRFFHAVPVDPHQPRDEPRFSIVFRPITDHPKGAKNGEHLAMVDAAKAARVQPGGDLWHEYLPICRAPNSRSR